METMIDHTILKDLRNKVAWSQDELAAISGVSLRTVQRMESTGRCSLESKRAVAAAFQVDSVDLDVNAERIGKLAGSARGAKWGMAGAMFGMLCAYAGITQSVISGDIVLGDAGVGYGVIGAACGALCALIGVISRAQKKSLTAE